ncbi:beta-lactamase class A [Tissierella praeacuta DSM 18095]|uniref:Beta-lactamase class A n=1 Tax=Tissierella praeacuta DSM 18095 TaxID=1123404 RepID=A0A1M4TR86_9FIRM|nr:serine hydrolase [Tissierella praeacuta]SHE46787.1 beta-lactamase class A [Tissierella praeacuta DSM 18095]SUP04400.1 Beta-lactamase SHV-24 precursor [Tissierella praeacuta]
MIKDIIIKEIDSVDEEVSIIIKDLTNDRWILKYNEDRVFPSASLIKIPIMIEVLERVEKGELSLDKKIKIKAIDRVDYSIISELTLKEYTLIDLITLMIILSDNTATNVLIDLLGYEKVNETVKKLNCNNTILKRKMMDFTAAKEGRENLTSPMDMALFMEKIYNKSIISPKICDVMIDILTRQKHRDMLPRYILDEVKIANKTGELSGINHDIGIFYLENINYLIGIFTTNGKDDLVGKRTIGRISKLVYDNFLRY